MIDIGIRLALPFVRIIIEMPHHILMYLPLQVYADCAIDSNNFVGTYSSVRRNIATWVRNPDIIRHISDLMVSPFYSGCDKSLNEILRHPVLRPSCRS